MSVVPDQSSSAQVKRGGKGGSSKGGSSNSGSSKGVAAKGVSLKNAMAVASPPIAVDADPAKALAHGFAERVVGWARKSGATEATLQPLSTAARLTSLATSAGHVCIRLDEVALELPGFPGLLLSGTLIESKMVGTPAAPGSLPLILDDQGRLYLHRYFDYERRLARALMARASGAPLPVTDAAKRQLDALFPSRGADVVDWQKIAAALALMNRLTIISGGPGTGKTTTVVNLLACVLAQDPACRIRLAAPTGKAAARMNEAIRQQSDRLSADVRPLLPTEAYTVHRLLGVVPDSSEFRHGTDNLLPVDMLIVDEASMLDLALATKLFEAVPQTARIILLGDKDQLSAVESGAIFSELSADPSLTTACVERLAALSGSSGDRIVPPVATTLSALTDSVVWFRENFRFSSTSGIGHLAAHVNTGDAEGALRSLEATEQGIGGGAFAQSRFTPAPNTTGGGDANADRSIDWIQDDAPVPAPETMRKIIEGGEQYLQVAREDINDRAALFEAFARFRVLCAERNGPRGVEGINRALSQHFRQALNHPDDPGNRSEWYPGRPVMVFRNDYVLKLFNGDTGIVLPDESGMLMVWFPETSATGDVRFRAVAPVRLPPHETAFATTVHKAQGSEFGAVLLMLPSKPTRVITRELLYTAITRARQRATIVSSAAVIEKAITSPTTRHSGLVDRLKEERQTRTT